MPTIQQQDTEHSSVNNESILKDILTRIRSSKNIKEDLAPLMQEMKIILQCEEIVLFDLDRENRQLFSRNTTPAKPEEIRLNISVQSLVGFVAATGKSMSTGIDCSEEHLAKYHPQLRHGSTLDNVLNNPATTVMAVALPYESKLVGVMEIVNRVDGNGFSDADLKLARDMSSAMGLLLHRLNENPAGKNKNTHKTGTLKKTDPGNPQGLNPATEVDSGAMTPCMPNKNSNKPLSVEEELERISQLIKTAKDVDETLEQLKGSIMALFEASMITIYSYDSKKKEIISRTKSETSIDEIRLPALPQSISGWVALKQKTVNIANVHDEEELQAIDPEIKFDSSWDKISGNTTISMLCQPLTHKGKITGILQVMNKTTKDAFTEQDVKLAEKLSATLAMAFLHQEKYSEKKPTKFSYLVKNGFISEEELTSTIAKARQSQVDLETVLLGILGLQRKDLGKSLEAFYNLPYFGYSESIILPKEVLSGLNQSFLLKNYWLPLSNEEDKVTILTNDPYNPDKYQNIKLIFPKKEIEFKIGLKADIVDFLNSIMGSEMDGLTLTKHEAMSSLLTTLEGETAEIEALDEIDDGASSISESDSAIVRLVNKILTDAYDRNVSDVHIEPGVGKDKVLVRFRKDGECRIYEEIPALYKQAIISRIKIMARLDIAERRMPQDGKIKMKYGRKTIEYRVATLPTVGGNEDAVLRILADSKPIPLEKMAFTQSNLDLIKTQIAKPYGLVLVVGPTGSGKTTTLHSCLGYINTPERKIWTAEDPVEITQKGLRQMQMLNKIGLNFARAMRSFLRGDPDVIMVGEMRDTETVAIGLEASLTGHLVFSTLHTNSAPETIVRLLDMGMNPLNFADALLLIVAQRLARTLCPDCKSEYHPNQEEFDALVREYGESDFKETGITFSKDFILKKPVGCHKCNDTGYTGRIALHELVSGTNEMKRKISKCGTVEELRQQAIKDGMKTLKQDGIIKVIDGHCDLKSILSVCIL